MYVIVTNEMRSDYDFTTISKIMPHRNTLVGYSLMIVAQASPLEASCTVFLYYIDAGSNFMYLQLD